MSVAVDRWKCHGCDFEYEGFCRPHEPFGWTVEEVGAHQWEDHRSVAPSGDDGTWSHHDAPREHEEHLAAYAAFGEVLTDNRPPPDESHREQC